MIKNIVILCGGQSTEHEISLRSAVSVINGLESSSADVTVYFIDKEGRFVPLGNLDHVEKPEDLIRKSSQSKLESIGSFCRHLSSLKDPMILPVLHGQTGEDGQIQGFLQTLGLPYVGCGITSSALCMDKALMNQVFLACGLPEARFIVIKREDPENADRDALLQRVREELGLPCFVKPANNGSSVGVNKADETNFIAALDEAFTYDHKIVIEEMISGHEVEVSVLGNEDARASKPGSYTSSHELLDYEAKYLDRAIIENIPHPMTEEQYQKCQKLALLAYHAAGCEGFARVDLFFGADGNFYVNEINTFPGMTVTSLAPKLWTALTDMTFAQYLNALMDYAEKSYARRNSIKNSWEI